MEKQAAFVLSIQKISTVFYTINPSTRELYLFVQMFLVQKVKFSLLKHSKITHMELKFPDIP